jgi:hypothetical protein
MLLDCMSAQPIRAQWFYIWTNPKYKLENLKEMLQVSIKMFWNKERKCDLHTLQKDYKNLWLDSTMIIQWKEKMA